MHFWISTEVVYLQRWHGWRHMKLLPSQCILCMPYNHAPCYYMQSHIRKVYTWLAVTCHLHFWQNDQGLLRATAVNIKIMSRTCRFETCRYLQLPNFKLRLISWEWVTYSILFHKVIKVLLPLSLLHTHTHPHTCTESIHSLPENTNWQSGKLWNFEHYFSGNTCIAYKI